MLLPEYEVRCRLRFRLFGKNYNYEDAVPEWESDTMQVADVHTTLLSCGGAKGRKQEHAMAPEKQTRGEQAQEGDYASAMGRMRVELAAAAPSQQRMMLQRALD